MLGKKKKGKANVLLENVHSNKKHHIIRVTKNNWKVEIIKMIIYFVVYKMNRGRIIHTMKMMLTIHQKYIDK